MKNRILLLLLFCISIINTYSQTQQQTLDWLNNKLYEYGDTTMGIYKVTTECFQGEEVIVIKQDSHYLGTSIYIIFPRSVKDVVTTKSCRTDDKRCVVIKAFDNYIVRTSNGGIPALETELVLSGKATPDSEIFKIQKSIIHLLKLLGTIIPEKKEYF